MGKDVVGVAEGALDPVGSADGELVGAMLVEPEVNFEQWSQVCKRRRGEGVSFLFHKYNVGSTNTIISP